eukprot:COSAG01_NODE_123_length_25210_cov_348.799434_5_plen_1182_part_00
MRALAALLVAALSAWFGLRRLLALRLLLPGRAPEGTGSSSRSRHHPGLGAATMRSATQQLSDGPRRVSALLGCLECASRLLMAAQHQQCMTLMKRVVLLHEGLEGGGEGGEAVAPWVAAEWTAEQCEAVGESIMRITSLEDSQEAGQGSTVTSAVTSLLSALDGVSESFVDRAEVLLRALQEGGEVGVSALAGVLEHGVSTLEALRISTPRRGRKVMTATSERVEEVLDSMEESGLTSQLASCEESCLAVLCERLCAVEALGTEGMDAESALARVEAVLEELERCGDPVACAGRQLASSEVSQRVQGLDALSALPQVVLAVACDAEVACVDVVLDICKDVRRSMSERISAAAAQFTLCLRNTTIPPDIDGYVTLHCSLYSEWTEATSDDINAATELLVKFDNVVNLVFEIIGKLYLSNAPLVQLAEEYFKQTTSPKAFHGDAFRSVLSVELCQQRLPLIIQMLTKQDIFDVAASCGIFGTFVAYSKAALAPVLMVPQVIDAILAAIRSIWDSQKDVSWWKERCDAVHLDTMFLCGILLLPFQLANRITDIPTSAQGRWDELIELNIQLAKMNQRAQLSAKTPMPTIVFYFAFRLISKQASFAAKREGLLASGMAEAALYASIHDSPMITGLSTAAPAAACAVQLIGRNEGGLTLCREAVHAVLDAFGNFFDPSKRHFTALASRALNDCWSITHMVVSDANKAFIVEHPSAIDNLVTGLLLDEDNPRRTQPGAAELQHACALALQNLTLSDIGAGPLRARGHVMDALHKLTEGGMTDEARRCAKGALFELEAERREPESLSVQANEHIMLSYNWDHQVVIKRVHASLVRRGYTTWIDVEKMQGSTVEAMAAAVEGAVAMCCGVSRAYKESANCRLEAQYAYQREKDMVPLLVEEGYRADGWLGMLLGARLYYVFFGSTLTSEAAFEGKMDELCRELGDRGTASTPAVESCLSDDVKTLVSPSDDRSALMVARLEAVLQRLASLTVVSRKQRRAQAERVEARLDELELDVAMQPAWLRAKWAAEHAEAVATAMSAAISEEGVDPIGDVADMLSALDAVAVAYVELAAMCVEVLQCGGEESEAALGAALEHGLEVLEALAVSTPRRRGRKSVEAVCDRIEAALENVGDLARQLAGGDEVMLGALSELLCSLKNLKVGEGVECTAIVVEALDKLMRCADPVIDYS